jgi:oligoendopeptidase F
VIASRRKSIRGEGAAPTPKRICRVLPYEVLAPKPLGLGANQLLPRSNQLESVVNVLESGGSHSMAVTELHDGESSAAAVQKVPERHEIESQHQWDLESMYADPAAWEAEFETIEPLVTPIESMRGKLNSAHAVRALFEARTRLDRMIEKLYVYAHLREDENTGDSKNQARMARIRTKYVQISGRLAWIEPELLAHSEDELGDWAEDEVLRQDRYPMQQLLRQKAHTLSEKEETLLSKAGEIFGAPYQTFTFLTNADIQFPQVKDESGALQELSHSRYQELLQSRDREVRRSAFAGMYDTFGGLKNTLASTLATTVKYHNFNAVVRHYPSAVEAALHHDNIPVSVYENLIDAVHKAFPTYFDYVALRKRQLGLDKLDMCDFYVPIVAEYEVKVSFEEARDWIVAAVAPLGDEYVQVIRSAFTDRWIDVYENKGKRSGAYSSGCYDSLPYILMNYNGTLNDVFTLAHELGHSMHTWLADHTQPYRLAQYPIFTAEIPSTVNEALLLHHLLHTQTVPRFKAYLLNYYCDQFKGTVFRQAMFAEFEKQIHAMDTGGTPLTHDSLSEQYKALNDAYYGPQVEADARIGLEWARIPHFYYNFYVYKYATSFCASQIFVQGILRSASERDRYLDMLRAGGSDFPLALIQRAGVDLSDRQTFDDALVRFHETVRQLDKTLADLGH